MKFGKNTLDLWCAYPQDVSNESTAHAYLALLSDDERARLQTFRFDRHRHEYLTTRALVRTALSHYHPTAPRAWHFKTSAHGKPGIDPDCGLRFNLSNSPDLVVCLIAQGSEVGVDVEPSEHAEQIARLAPEIFSPVELAHFEALPDLERLNCALSLWTLKEAYIKATGAGLYQPLKQFSFRFGGAEGIRLELDPLLSPQPIRQWRFCLIEHAGHRIALMAECATAPELRLWHARPASAPPEQLSPRGELWFPASEVASTSQTELVSRNAN